jgi:serine/threonine protein kinase/tetratricopeptide (TPR) repeat protein
MLGYTLANRYRIEAEVGRGGMGIVYRGYDTRLNRTVAIKILSSPELSEEEHIRLLAEAQAAAQLNHPNVVTVYDALEVDNQPFIVMEYVEGQTLRSVRNPTLKESLEYMRQICSALAHAHSKGIIHRDLKPENALLTPEGIVKLMDFGLARYIDAPRITRTGALTGTFAYMAPELIQGEAASPQSDLYALGMMFYEFLTGKSPFETSNLAKLISQHLYEQVPPPRDVVSGLPAGLNELVTQMLEKKPENRPTSARAVETVLISFQTDRAVPLPTLLDQLGVQSLDELARSRAPDRAKWEREWKRKSYPKSAIPALETGEKSLILANRARELAKSIQHLNEHRILLITGMPGIGKSSLARTLLEFMPPESPPPFWYNFERQQSSGNTLGVLLDRISGYLEKILGSDVREEILSFRNSPEHQASSYDVDVLIDSLNQPTPLWLIFDNFEVVLSKGGQHFLDEGLEMLFSGLKRNTHNAKIVISSLFIPRLKDGDILLEYGTRPVTLQGLEEKFAVECLRVHGLKDFPDEILATIARKVDGHPFALNHAARYVEALGVQDALKNLQGGIEEFSERFRTSLEQRLPADEFSVLQDLTVLQRDISLEGLCRTAQTKPATIKRLREEGLLDASDAGKFWLPTIVRESLGTEQTEKGRRAHLRAAQFYREQKRHPDPRQIDDVADTLEWHFHAIQAGEAAEAYKALFPTGLIEQLKQWNEFALSVELCDAIREAALEMSGSLSNNNWIHLNQILGELHYYLGNYEKSLSFIQAALQTLSPADPVVTKAKLLVYYTATQIQRGDLESAWTANQEATDLMTDTRDDLVNAKILQTRGLIYRAQGKFHEAIHNLEEARKLFESRNDLRAIAYVTGELGIAYYYLNEFRLAIENYRRATLVCERIKDQRGVMIGHLNVGDVLLQQGRYQEAIGELTGACEIAQRKKVLCEDEFKAGLYLAEAHIATGNHEEAQKILDALQPAILRQNSPLFSGHLDRLQASLFWQQGNSNEALECFQRALERLEGKDCLYEKSRAYLEYAVFKSAQGLHQEALIALERAKDGFAAINNLLGLQAIEQALQRLQLTRNAP